MGIYSLIASEHCIFNIVVLIIFGENVVYQNLLAHLHFHRTHRAQH